jgi:hypothetical protein
MVSPIRNRTRDRPMPTVTSRRDDLSRELLVLELEIGPKKARQEEIKSELKKDAKDVGKSLKIEVEGLGVVKVAPPHAGEFKGIFPVPKVDEILAARSEKDKKLMERWIDMVATYGSPYYGSVTVEPY